MVRSCRVLSVAVYLLLSVLWRRSEAAIVYTPTTGAGSQTSYDATSDSSRFPDVSIILDEDIRYFINELNFDAIDGKLLVGAADKLYQLSTDLAPEREYSWFTSDTSNTICEASEEGNSFTCRNHIRVYKKIPAQPDLLLICGTQSAENPQCRTLSISGGNVDVDSNSTETSATNGMISYYPFFNGFGDFRESNAADTTYLTAGFFDGSNGIGLHFSISYQDITFSNPSDADTLTLTERFSTISDNNYWLRNPVTFVDFVKMDYTPVPPADDAEDYELYFLFLREQLFVKFNSFNILSSRVVRICRNDPGSMPGSQQYFTTYMKARIYCNQRLPSGRDDVGAIDYIYEELMSVSFNNRGRYVENSQWNRAMYGAFSSSAIGPKASAICIYSAANSLEVNPSGTGQDMGIFDIFRADIIEAQDGMAVPDEETLNSFFECNPGGRSDDDARNQVIIASDVVQAVPDPLLVLEDVYVTKMVLDQVCVVTRNNRDSCVNQDILFLATDTGKVMKVVFGLDVDSNSFPIIVEEIELDDDNAVSQMELQEVGGVKYIFVSTNTKLYRFPLQRCSRHESCDDCIGSRDPYCVWNTGNMRCEAATTTILSAIDDNPGVVNSVMYRQNIHTGLDRDTCDTSPVCDVNATALPNTLTILVQLQCSVTTQVIISIPAISVAETVPLESDGTAMRIYTANHGLQTLEITVQTDAGSGPEFTVLETTPPAEPIDLDSNQIYADDITATSFRVTVNPAIFTDAFENYEFRVQGPLFTTTPYQALTVSRSVTITDLPASAKVNYTVELRNSVDMVQSPVFCVDLRDAIPGAVQNLMVSDITEYSVTLAWSEPLPAETNGDIDGYSISWTGDRELSVTGTMNTITGLMPSTAYTFNVRACNDAGCGAAESISATTECAPAEQVTNFMFTMVTANSLSYSWSPPTVLNGDMSELRYNVRSTCYLPIGGEMNVNEDSSTLTSGSVMDLEPLTYCCVTVTAVNTCDINGVSTSVDGLDYVECQQTNDIAPGPVRDLTVTALSPTSLLVVWTPPANYGRPGLTYTITIDSVNPVSVLDQTNYFIDDLTANTEYSIGVSGSSGAGSGSEVSVTQSTSPAAPDPPTSPVLTFPDPGDLTRLTFTWNDTTSVTFDVMEYRAFVRCNEFEDSMNVSSTDMTVDFVIDDPGSDFSWCTGQVQAVNSVGRSRFSELADVVVPSRVPSQPRCFLTDDFGSAVNISFTITDPFSLSELNVMYTIESDLAVETRSYLFNAENGTNDVIVQVTRNTVYDFQLVLCNVAGCGLPCQELRNFTTSTASPRPPTDITASDITATTVNVTWEPPLFENEDAIEYIVQLSGTTTAPLSVEGLTQRWYVFEGLLPERDYTVAIRVRDTESNITGVFGPAQDFTMLYGISTEPRNVRAFDVSSVVQILSVVYGIPENTNGTLTQYEILWANTSVANCDSPTGVVQRAFQTDLESNEFTTEDVGNINASRVLLVCVRAYTQQPGKWGHYISLNFTLGAFGTDGGTDDCNGLIPVAVIAGVAVASSILMAILLAFVVHTRWRPLNKWCGPGDYDYDDSHKFNSQMSAGSTTSANSTTGLLKTESKNGELDRNGTKDDVYHRHTHTQI